MKNHPRNISLIQHEICELISQAICVSWQQKNKIKYKELCDKFDAINNTWTFINILYVIWYDMIKD